MKVSHITISIVLSLTLFGCASKHYEEAVQADTISSYSTFLKEYGDSDYTYKARSRLNQLTKEYNAWYRAREKNSISGYNSFLSKYSNGRYAYRAKQYRDNLKEKQYIDSLKNKIKNSKSAIEQAVIMTKYAYKKPYNYAIKNDSFLEKYYQNANNCFKTKKDIIVVHIETDWKDLIFVDKRIDTIYAGKVLKGDIVYKDGNYIRTMHSLKDLKNLITDKSQWYKKHLIPEAFGSIDEFKKENKLSNKDLFDNLFYTVDAEKFVPTKYIKTTSSLEGALIDFIEENPLTSLAIGAGVATMLNSSDDSSSSSSYSGSNYSYNYQCHDKCSEKYNTCLTQCVGLNGSNGIKSIIIGDMGTPKAKCKSFCSKAKSDCKDSCN